MNSLDELVQYLAKDGVHLDLWRDDTGALELQLIFVQRSRQKRGVGSWAMKEICEWADEHDEPITLTPSSTLGVPLDTLSNWYSRFGFRWTPAGWMRREPNTQLFTVNQAA